MLLAPLVGGVAGCSLIPKAKYQPPAPRPVIKAPAPGEAARIGTSGNEFNFRLTEWAEQGHYKDSIEAARIRLKNEPQHAGAQYALAHSLYYNGDFAGAATEAQKLVQLPQYQSDGGAKELLDDAQSLATRYAGQKFAPVAWMPNDVETTSDKWSIQAASLIAAGKYDEIESVAKQLTDQPEIMTDGGWTLAAFFVGLWNNDGSEASWEKSHAQLEKWAAARPQSKLAQVCLARSWTDGAWNARGAKFGHEISDETWKLVGDRQSKAEPILTRLLATRQAFSPLVYAAAQRYGRLGNEKREWHDDIFERAIAQFPTYVDFHRERSTMLLPRWYGGKGEWEREAARVADAQPSAAAGDQLYARIVWHQWDNHKNMRQQTRIDWDRTKRGFDALLKRHPNSLAAATIYLRLCHQWNDYARAQQLIPILAGRADASSWKSPAHFAQTRNFLLKQT